MSVKELMDLIVAAIGDLQGLCKSYIGVPYTACTVEEFSHRCFLILERYNLHLRKVLGIELYLVVGANFDDFNTIINITENIEGFWEEAVVIIFYFIYSRMLVDRCFLYGWTWF